MQNQIMAAPNATKNPMINQIMAAPHLPKQALLRRARFPVRAVAPLPRLRCRAAIIPPSPNDKPNSLNNRRGDYSSRTEEEMMTMYEEWCMKHRKLYNNLNLDEKMKRFEIFKDNLKYIDDRNAENRGYKLGLNQFADLTNEEYRSRYLGFRTDLSNRDAAESVDGRKQGDVSQVKDQGGCGE